MDADTLQPGKMPFIIIPYEWLSDE